MGSIPCHKTITPTVNFEIQLNTLPNLRMISGAHFLASPTSWVKAVKQEHSVNPRFDEEEEEKKGLRQIKLVKTCDVKRVRRSEGH